MLAIVLAAVMLVGTAQAQALPTQQRLPDLIAAGPDAVWFSELRPSLERTESWIGRMTPSGLVTDFRARLPSPRLFRDLRGDDPSLLDLAADPGGAVWFVGGTAWIGRLTPNGTVTRFRPRGAGAVTSVTWGPDGNLWFTASPGIGRMTQRGAVTFFPLRRGELEAADGITSGPDGQLWFVLSMQQGNGWVERIAKMTTSGVITAFRALTPPLCVGAIGDLTAGPDGNVWFTESHACAGVGPRDHRT